MKEADMWKYSMNVLKKKTKCYIYTRVSTAIQVDGYSLDAQKDKLKNMQNFRIWRLWENIPTKGIPGRI